MTGDPEVGTGFGAQLTEAIARLRLPGIYEQREYRRYYPSGEVLSQVFRVGKRHRGLYLRLVVDTGRGQLTAYLNGRVLKRWPYKLLND